MPIIPLYSDTQASTLTAKLHHIWSVIRGDWIEDQLYNYYLPDTIITDTSLISTSYRATWTEVYYQAPSVVSEGGEIEPKKVLLAGLRPWNTLIVGRDMAIGSDHLYL